VSKCFIVLIDSAGHGKLQKKSLPKSDPGKGVNLHIFKMADIENFTVLLTIHFSDLYRLTGGRHIADN